VEAADSVVQEVGWPFLVSAGLVRDYTVLVAPDFLVAGGEQGLLGIAGGAVDGGPIESRTVRTSSGRLLALSYAARLLTSEDSSGTVADEFGRPLRLVVGVVTDRSRATDPSRDLARAEEVVLPAYRRFRADESAYRVEPSHREPMRSLGLREPEGLPAPVAVPYREPVAVPYAAMPDRPRMRPVVSPVLLVFGVVVALMLVLLLLFRPWATSGGCVPAPSTTTTTTTTTTTPGVGGAAGTGRVTTTTCP
jgi:hypothetical protein